MDAAVRALAARLLIQCGIPEHFNPSREFSTVPKARDLLGSTESAWGITGIHRMLIPTANVVRTNIENAQVVHASARIHAESNFAHLFRLLHASAADVQPFVNAHVPLTAEQVAMSVVLARWPALDAVKISSWPESRKRARETVFFETDVTDDGNGPAFAWVTPTMGAGKTAIATQAACFFIEDGWNQCRDSFGAWKTAPLNRIAGMPTHSSAEHIVRAVIVAAPEHILTQWHRALKTLKPDLPIVHVRAPLEYENASAGEPLTDVLRERLFHPNDPVIILMSAATLVNRRERAARHHIRLGMAEPYSIAVAAVIVDEFHALPIDGVWSPAAAAFPSAPFVPAFRIFAITATPKQMVLDKLLHAEPGSFFKRVVYQDPTITKFGTIKKHMNNVLARFTACNVACELQHACGVSSIDRMVPVVDFRIVRVRFATHLDRLLKFHARLGTERRCMFVPDAWLGHACECDDTPWSLFGACVSIDRVRALFRRLVSLERKRCGVVSPDGDDPMRSEERPDGVTDTPEDTDTFDARVARYRAILSTNAIVTDAITMDDHGFLSGLDRAIAHMRCAACDGALSADAHVNACCSSVMCGPCARVHGASEKEGGVGARLSPCSYCDTTTSASARSVKHALRAALTHMLASGSKKVCVFATRHMVDRRSLALFQAALHGTGVRPFVTEKLVTTSVREYVMLYAKHFQKVVDDFRACDEPAACLFQENARQNASLAGVDMGFCDGAIVLGHLENEQQAFSRVLRFGTDAHASVRITRITFDDVPTVTVRVSSDRRSPEVFPKCMGYLTVSEVHAALNDVWTPHALVDTNTLLVDAADANNEVGVKVQALASIRIPSLCAPSSLSLKPVPLSVAAAPAPYGDFIERIIERSIRSDLEHAHADALPTLDVTFAPADPTASNIPFVCAHIVTPPVIGVFGDALAHTSVVFQFAASVVCELVPPDADGLCIELNAHRVPIARWFRQSDAPAEVRLPIRCPALLTVKAHFENGDEFTVEAGLL